MGLTKAGERALFDRADRLLETCDYYAKKIQAYKDVLTLLHPREGVWITPTDAEEKFIAELLRD